jgi:DNA-binding MarR family transcriptional regulator
MIDVHNDWRHYPIRVDDANEIPAIDFNCPVPVRVADNAGYLLYRLGAESKRRFAEAVASVGLRIWHHPLLVLLDDRGPCPQTLIAEALAIDPAQVVGLVDELEKAGLVVRVRDAVDRRRYAVTITDAGRAAVFRSCAAAKDSENDLLAPLAEAERTAFRAMLRRVAVHHDPRIPAG